MTKKDFDFFLEENAAAVTSIRDAAGELHRSVGQQYGNGLPYLYHLQMVADVVMEYGYLVCESREDILPMIFGAYFHDSIEDARYTYNDVKRHAGKLGMTPEQAVTAAEIVYALTDEKGRTRAERQSERYYDCIRETPYAPFVKMSDRLANMRFSFKSSEGSPHMKEVYRGEFPDFIWGISKPTDDIRFRVPSELVDEVWQMIGEL